MSRLAMQRGARAAALLMALACAPAFGAESAKSEAPKTEGAKSDAPKSAAADPGKPEAPTTDPAKAAENRKKPLQRCDQLVDKAQLDCLQRARERVVEARKKREAAGAKGTGSGADNTKAR